MQKELIASEPLMSRDDGMNASFFVFLNPTFWELSNLVSENPT